MHFAMFVAFALAGVTCLGAGIDELVDDLHIGAGHPRCDHAGRRADIAAIEVTAYALGKSGRGWFCKAGIRAARASLSAGVAFLDAPEQRDEGF